MTNKTKQNRKNRDNSSEDDEYVYPTKKGREHKTRNRRSDKNLIKRGLVDYENGDPDDTPMSDLIEDQEITDDYNEMLDEFDTAFLDEDDPYEDDWYDDSPMEESDGEDFSDAVFEYHYTTEDY